MRMRLGFVVNPWAGIGGPAALKGSDGETTVEQALNRGATPQACCRAELFLNALQPVRDQVHIITCAGDMGQQGCERAGLSYETLDVVPVRERSTAADTACAAEQLAALAVDLLVFVGGDGTARDIYNAVGTRQLCLGVPAGVKMHSGVYGVTPVGSAEIVKKLVQGELVSEQMGEVRDIDEEALRREQVKTRHYGELRVPDEGRYLQHVKCGGREDEQLVLVELAAYLRDNMEPSVTYMIGSGKTTQALKHELGLEGSLLGVDVVRDGALVIKDATECQLFEVAKQQPCRLILSVIGGQGHLFGRGNQQLSPRVIKEVGLQNIQAIASKSKLATLAGRPLQVDTGDNALNQALSGWISILAGYDDRVLYPVEFNG